MSKKVKGDHHNKPATIYELYHEENPYNRVLKKAKVPKLKLTPIKKGK